MLTQPALSTAPGVGPGTYRVENGGKHPGGIATTIANCICWQYILCTCIICTESYAPFCSMAVRRSFLTVGEQQASAPGPAHYTPTLEDDVKGGGSLKSKVCCTYTYMYMSMVRNVRNVYVVPYS